MVFDPRIPSSQTQAPDPAGARERAARSEVPGERGAGRRAGRRGLARERGEAHLRAAAAAAEGVLLHDESGLIVGCNPAAERMLGAVEAELVASGTLSAGLDVFDGHGLPLAPRDLPAVRALATGEAQEDVLALRGGDGSVTWVVASARPLAEEGADAPYAVVVSLRVVPSRSGPEAR